MDFKKIKEQIKWIRKQYSDLLAEKKQAEQKPQVQKTGTDKK